MHSVMQAAVAAEHVRDMMYQAAQDRQADEARRARRNRRLRRNGLTASSHAARTSSATTQCCPE